MRSRSVDSLDHILLNHEAVDYGFPFWPVPMPPLPGK